MNHEFYFDCQTQQRILDLAARRPEYLRLNQAIQNNSPAVTIVEISGNDLEQGPHSPIVNNMSRSPITYLRECNNTHVTELTIRDWVIPTANSVHMRHLVSLLRTTQHISRVTLDRVIFANDREAEVLFEVIRDNPHIEFFGFPAQGSCWFPLRSDESIAELDNLLRDKAQRRLDRQERALAFALGSLPRSGKNSLVRGLKDELVSFILSLHD
jgi:hypothetical protein